MADPGPGQSQELFVETSIFIWRLNRPRGIRRRIDARLRNGHPVTSTYVKAEYIHTVLRAAVRLYVILVSRRDVQEAAAQWRSVPGGGQVDLGHWLIEGFLARADGYDQAERSLRNLIDLEIMAWFDECGCELTDVTRCAAASARVIWADGGPSIGSSFPPATAPAGLQEFLGGKRPELTNLRAVLADEQGSHWPRVCKALDMLLEGDHSLGLRQWQRMGDLVIALEAHHHGCSVYTTNKVHFAPVCQSLGIGVVPETTKD